MSTDRYWVLLAKKKSGEATEAELHELEQLGDADKVTGEIVDRVWLAPMEAVPQSFPNKQVWNRIQQNVYVGEHRKGRMVTLARWSAAAAVVGLAVGAWFLKPHRSIAPMQTQTLNQVATQAGSKTRVELPDGTQVWLNANSQINYSAAAFGLENRQVTLTGEAYFDVAKNEKIPFVIQTGEVTIKVLGTAFTVRAYPREHTVETALIRGSVSVTTRQDPERPILLKPAEKLIVPVSAPVEPGATHPSAPASPYSIVRLKKDTTIETVWTRNKLEFDNETFEELAPRLENWYHITIHFSDGAVRKRRFSGVIEKETITQTLDAMRLSGHFEYQLKENDLWLREN